jgi:hypothetical protein
MCSSAEPAQPSADPPFGWDAFTERPAAARLELGSPAAELASLLQRYRSAVNVERGKARAAADDALAVAAEQAVLTTRLDAALARHRAALDEAGLGRIHRELRVLKDQMIDALRDGGVTTEDPAGRPLEKVADRIEVIGWRHGSQYPAEVVAETHDAIVWYREAVLRPGQVTMGAPPAPAEDESLPAGDDKHREQE